MEDNPNVREQASKRARDRVQNLGGALSSMLERNREGAQYYEQAGRLSRWLIRRQQPEIFEQYQTVQKVRAIHKASESIQEAKFAAQEEADNSEQLRVA